VFACASHAVLCGSAVPRLREAPIRQVVVTDSIPITPQRHLPNLEVRSVAPLLADAIKRIHLNESVSKLFE
jgi:ribose-phosphate pyrophosphokinase